MMGTRLYTCSENMDKWTPTFFTHAWASGLWPSTKNHLEADGTRLEPWPLGAGTGGLAGFTAPGQAAFSQAVEPVGSAHGAMGQGIDPVEKNLGAGAPLAPQDEVAAYGPLMAHLVDLWKARHRAWLWFGAFWPWLQWLQWNQPKWPNAWSCGEALQACCGLLLGLGLGGRGLGLRLGLRLGHLGVLGSALHGLLGTHGCGGTWSQSGSWKARVAADMKQKWKHSMACMCTWYGQRGWFNLV